VLAGIDLKANVISMLEEEIRGVVAAHTGNSPGEEFDIAGLLAEVNSIYPLPATVTVEALAEMKPGDIEDTLIDNALAAYQQREQELSDLNARMVERLVMLRTIDNHWIEHLTAMENTREGIGLQAIAQRDPLVAYKREGSVLFDELKANTRRDVARTIFHVQIVREEVPKQQQSPMAKVAAGNAPKAGAKAGGQKVGRNDPCPCGSGKKYKHCHGK